MVWYGMQLGNVQPHMRCTQLWNMSKLSDYETCWYNEASLGIQLQLTIVQLHHTVYKLAKIQEYPKRPRIPSKTVVSRQDSGQ